MSLPAVLFVPCGGNGVSLVGGGGISNVRYFPEFVVVGIEYCMFWSKLILHATHSTLQTLRLPLRVGVLFWVRSDYELVLSLMKGTSTFRTMLQETLDHTSAAKGEAVMDAEGKKDK